MKKRRTPEPDPPPREPMTFGYVRASTARQVESPETQKGLIQTYADRNGLGLVDAFYVDAGVSGNVAITEREAGKQLMAMLRPGDSLVVSSLDRAFRKLSDCAIIIEDLRRRGIRLHVCNLMGGAIDLSQPIGLFLVQMLAAVAQLERSFNSERVKAGLARRVRNNVKHSKNPGYGYKWGKRTEPDGKVVKCRVIDHEERAVMGKIVDWRDRANAMSVKAIADYLGSIGAYNKGKKRWTTYLVNRLYIAELHLQAAEKATGKTPETPPWKMMDGRPCGPNGSTAGSAKS